MSAQQSRTRAVFAIALLIAVWLAAAPAGAWKGGGHKQDVGERHDKRALEDRLDAALDRVRAQVGEPGVQAAVTRNGRLLWSAERGTAIEPDVPVRKHTLFSPASFGKSILAAYALHRVEAGELNLDVPISQYVGDSVAGSGVVTARMLLSHTSGYNDVYASSEIGPFFADQYDPNREWSFELLAQGIHDPVDPGAHWEYSNTGYIVLAHVLDVITRPPLEAALTRFLSRAGLSEQSITMRRSPQALRRFAHSYFRIGSGFADSFEGAAGIPTDLYGLPFGDAAFAGTGPGLARFLDALFVTNRLLRYSSVRQMVEPTPQSLAAGPFGEMLTYGLGTASFSAGGRAWQGHDGQYVGFTSMGATDFARGVSIAVTANRQAVFQNASVAIWRALAEELEQR